MALIVIPWLLSKRPWARIRARCEASFFIVLSKSSRCWSVRGHTYLTIIHLSIGFTYRIVLKLSREILYQKTFGRALTYTSRAANRTRESRPSGMRGGLAETWAMVELGTRLADRKSESRKLS